MIDDRIAGHVKAITKQNAKYRLLSVEWWDPYQADGKNNLFIDVVDEYGRRLVGEPVYIQNGGTVKATTEAKPGDPGGTNIGMTGALGSYTVWVGERHASDEVTGLGLGTPAEPWRTIHTCFVVRFVKGQVAPEPQPPAPPPEPPETEPEPAPDLTALESRLVAARGAIDEALAEVWRLREC